MRKKFLALLCLSFLLIFGVAQVAFARALDYDAFLEALAASGFEVEKAGPFYAHYRSAGGEVIYVGGERLILFGYGVPQPDGFAVPRPQAVQITWVPEVLWSDSRSTFRVVYSGDDEGILAFLDRTFRPDTATVTIDTITVTIDGTPVIFPDQNPIIVGGRTLAPLRGVFEPLGFDVSWCGISREAVLERDTDTIIVTADSDIFFTNGNRHSLDVPAQVINRRIMLPIRAVVESVGYSVSHDRQTRTISISTAPQEIVPLDFTPLPWDFPARLCYANSPSGYAPPIVIKSVHEITEDDFSYGEEFFAENFLVLFEVMESSGSIQLRVDGVYSNGNIYVTRTIPEVGTDDMRHWRFALAVENSVIPEQFTLVVTNVHEGITASGTITENGSNLPWELHRDGTLVVGGGNLYWHRYWTSASSFRQQSPWSAYREYICGIIFTAPIVAGSQVRDLFAGLPGLTFIDGLHFFDNSAATTLRYFFSGARVESLDLRGFSIGGAGNIDGMFSGTALTSLDLSGFDTSGATSMAFFFSRSHSLENVDLSSFDTGNVTCMMGMFNEASSLTSLDLSNFDVRNVRNMQHMFQGASGLTSLNLSGWEVSGPIALTEIFRDASSLTSLDLSGWDTRTSSMGGAFSGMTSLRELTLGENFKFTSDWIRWHGEPGEPGGRYEITPGLPNPPNNDEFTGRWQNVGNGTPDNPQGEFVFTAGELMRYYDGSIHADTWVWERRG